MFFDWLLNIDGARAGIFFISPNKDILRYILRIHFPVSNNVDKYEASLHGIQLAMELGVKRLYIHGDSALVINQLNKDWDTTQEKMELYCKEIRKWEANFYGIEYIHVVQDKNQASDVLSKLGSSQALIQHGIFVQDLVKPSIGDDLVEKENNEALFVHNIQGAPPITNSANWGTPFIKYLTDGTGLEEKIENERLIQRSRNYLLTDGRLMCKNTNTEILMKCIIKDDGFKLLEDIQCWIL